MATRKGDIAKQYVADKIIQTFGDSYVCTKDKKIYLNIKEGNEIAQIAISLTMPKVPVENELQSITKSAWDDNTTTTVSTDLSVEDKQQVERLKNILKERGVYQE